MYKGFLVNLHINLFKDAANSAKLYLKQNNITYDQSLSDEDILLHYFTWVDKQITTKPREVHFSKSFETKNLNSNLQKGAEKFIKNCKKGHSLTKYQSRKITTTAPDDMYSHWKIHHFHLGINPSKKNPNLVEGTKELIFGIVHPNAIYLIGVYEHGDWSRQELIKIIQDNWPHLLQNNLLPNNISLAYSPNDSDIAKLRKAGINPSINTGNNQFIFNGVNGKGFPMDATMKLIKLNKLINKLKTEKHSSKQNIIDRHIDKLDQLLKKSPHYNCHQYNILINYHISNLLDYDPCNILVDIQFTFEEKSL